jgi:hypothetical protein
VAAQIAPAHAPYADTADIRLKLQDLEGEASTTEQLLEHLSALDAQLDKVAVRLSETRWTGFIDDLKRRFERGEIDDAIRPVYQDTQPPHENATGP